MSDLTIDPDDLTLGEVEQLEELTGKPLGEMFNGAISAKAATALVYVIKRREDPAFTLDDARAFKIGGLNIAGESDPTNGGVSTSSPPSATSGA
ncbi:MAG: hypothetical protein M3Q48_09810 [Actinomycetota bacterium]|nr:hypothetical protein [Actinomycetota bacterium]